MDLGGKVDWRNQVHHCVVTTYCASLAHMATFHTSELYLPPGPGGEGHSLVRFSNPRVAFKSWVGRAHESSLVLANPSLNHVLNWNKHCNAIETQAAVIWHNRRYIGWYTIKLIILVARWAQSWSLWWWGWHRLWWDNQQYIGWDRIKLINDHGGYEVGNWA